MKKKVIVDYTRLLELYDLLAGNLNDVIATFQDLAKEHGGDTEIEVEWNYDEVEINLVHKREETDEEYEKRLERNRKARETRRRNQADKALKATDLQRREYEKLKKIFEGE